MKAAKSTFKIIFYLRKDKMKKNSFTPIFCRVTISGESVSFNIHTDIHVDMWDANASQASGKTREAMNINRILDSCKTSLHNMYRDIFERDNFVSAEKLKNAYLGISTDNTMLLELFNQHNKDVESLLGINKTKATLQKYKVTYTRLSDFMRHKYSISDINVKEIKYQFIVDFENYLRTECNCNANTTAKFIQFFKRIIIIARNNGWMQHDPFANYKIRIKKVDRGYLTEEELQKIKQKELTIDRLIKVRDIFIFSCYTGLSFAEICHLRKDNIQKMNDGSSWIFIKRKKTDVMSYIPLLPIPIQLIGKYQNTKNADLIFSTYTNQKTNEYLKEIAEVCNIHKNLTFHVARHSFATLALSYGVSIESISGMLGHTNINTTQIYAQITKEKIGDEMRGFERGLINADELSKRMKKGYDIYLQLLGTARKMKEDKFSIEQIIYYTGLSRDEVVTS